ncbi:MAG: hypothetical protein GX918_03395, partial [Clostridiales bacterium]|nr:hypothetical protein [Clostridiales bacterium]
MKIIGLDGSYSESMEELLNNRRRIIQEEYLSRVKRIIDRVREDGDEALAE